MELMSVKDGNGRGTGVEWVEWQKQQREEGLFTPIARRGIDDPASSSIVKVSMYQIHGSR